MSICVGLSVSVVSSPFPEPQTFVTSSAFGKQPRFLSFSGISFLQSCLGSLSVLKLLSFFHTFASRVVSKTFAEVIVCLFSNRPLPFQWPS